MMSLNEEDEYNNENNNNIFIKEIREKVNIMKNSEYRTINFSLIEYFVNNNFHPLDKEFLILNLSIDYTINPERYIITKNKNEVYKSEKTFRKSLLYYISCNNFFKKGPGKDQLSLNLEKTCEYLRSVYGKYVNNSREVNTPVKVCNNSNNKKNNNKSQMKNVKKKLVDSDDFDIEIINDKKHSFSHNIFRKNNKSLKKSEKASHNNELINNNSIIALSESSFSTITLSDEKPQCKKKGKEYPEIFLKRLVEKKNFISSLNEYYISKLLNSIKEYILDVDIKGSPENIKENLINVDNSLQKLYEYIISFREESKTLDDLQKEIFHMWKLMSHLLKMVKKGINKEFYSYDIYVILKDAIIKFGKTYLIILKKIKYSLKEITDLDMKSEEEVRIIRKTLALINYRDLHGLFDSVIKKLKIDNDNCNISDDVQSQENEEVEDDYNYFKKNGIDRIINDFQEERKKIVIYIKDLDKDIGNITID